MMEVIFHMGSGERWSRPKTVLTLRTIGLTILIYAVLAGAFALLGIQMLDWSEYRHLAQSAIKTVGRVTAKEPENHNSIRYSFAVNGVFFYGLGHGGGENPPFDQLQVGSEVVVYYDSQNPESSFLGNPQDQAIDVTTGVIFIAFFGSLGAMITLYLKRWLPVSPES